MFLHAVKEDPASRSYGLQVAQLAGVPREVIAAARRYLAALEAQRDAQAALSPQGPRTGAQAELPLFAADPMRAAAPARGARGGAIPDELTLEGGARGALYACKRLLLE